MAKAPKMGHAKFFAQATTWNFTMMNSTASCASNVELPHSNHSRSKSFLSRKRSHSSRHVHRQFFKQASSASGLGGEHSITAPLVRAHAQKVPDLTILQFDAHADLRIEYDGTPYSHACVMARIAEFLDPSRITQVGIRALSKEEASFIRSAGVRTFFAHAIRRGDAQWMDRVLEGLSEHVYITFDVDALDPSIMPATGTPEPEGLTYSECIAIVKRLIETGRRIVGFDVVELAPIKKLHHPNLTAARLVYKLLNLAFAHDRSGKRASRTRRIAR